MKLGDKKKQELYKAFSEPITKLRIDIHSVEPDSPIDRKLFKLKQDIWKAIVDVLKIEKP